MAHATPPFLQHTSTQWLQGGPRFLGVGPVEGPALVRGGASSRGFGETVRGGGWRRAAQCRLVREVQRTSWSQPASLRPSAEGEGPGFRIRDAAGSALRAV